MNSSTGGDEMQARQQSVSITQNFLLLDPYFQKVTI